MRALSIRQPWAWLIVNGHKDIENRDWSTAFRGQVLIHAGKAMSRKYYDEVMADLALQFGRDAPPVPAYELLERGGIVGVATIADCVTVNSSPWFQGAFGFVMAEARPLPFHACNGALGYFDVQGVRP
jgi:hypothetical protein